MPTVSPASAAHDVARRAAAHRSRGDSAASPSLIALITLLVGAGVVLWSSTGSVGERETGWWQPLAIAVAVVITESTALHLEFRRQAFSMSLSEAPVVVGLFFLPPLALLAARLGGAAASFAIRRTRAAVAAFNLPLFAVEIGVAATVLRAFGAFDGSSAASVHAAHPLSWLAAFTAVVAYDAVSAVGVVLAIVATQARLNRTDIWRITPAVAASGLFGTTIGLLVVVVLRAQPAAAALLGVLAIVLLLGFRAFAGLSRRHATLNEVRIFTQQVAEAPDGRQLAAVLLRTASRMLNAAGATLRILDPGPGAVLGTSRLRADGELVSAGSELRADDAVRSAVMFGAQSVVLARGGSDPVHRRWLAAEGVRDALLVPLTGSSGVLGCLEVTDRLGEVATFTESDRELAETLAAAVAVALENARLVEKSLHDATHDPLTGLQNRALFMHQIELALGTDQHPPSEARERVAVLVVDLDRFKEVNDTLGHLSGDHALSAVADLLRDTVPPGAAVARLGGDEFGILLPRVGDRATAIRTAGDLRFALQRPLQLSGLALEVAGSFGVAISTQDGRDAGTLLQRAAAAMDAGKRSDPGSVRGWDSSLDIASPRRLALVGELRRALEQGELRVHYQPKVALPSGDVVGVEALVRWEHPVWGLLPPDEFVPTAEATGLIVPLTSVVLRTALRDCRQWLTGGLRVGVAVNLSVRGLLDPALRATVRGLLGSAGVPADRLTLEITESHLMSDVARALPVLQSLHELGVKLSVDDFGTGYSSLAYLRRLPVDEIKIDKSFVAGLTEQASDVASASAIVETIVGLADTLGLSVVAEGVEDEQSWARLVRVGCNVAQGYLISRPLSAAELGGWIKAWQSRGVARRGPVSLPGRPL